MAPVQTNTLCPPAYDTNYTGYVAGELVEVSENIFQCHEDEVNDAGETLNYELYCNVAEWDSALADENPNAQEMWNSAWIHVGPCVPTSTEEIMEEEAKEEYSLVTQEEVVPIEMSDSDISVEFTDDDDDLM